MDTLYSCFKCNTKKPKDEFYKCSNRSTGIASRCKTCDSKARPSRWATDEKYREACRRHTRKRDAKPEQRIKNSMRSRIRKIWKKQLGDISAIRHLGCTYQEFLEHISNLFEPSMSLDNYGEWHIDHKTPLSWFDLNNPEEVKKACHYTNLQPKWARDNLIKGNKNNS